MFNEIMNMLMAKYGGLSHPQLLKALRADGLGEMVDVLEKDPLLKQLLATIKDSNEIFGGEEVGIIPANLLPQSRPVESGEMVPFNEKACLANCNGKCCRDRNYLMLNIVDIYQIVSSPAAKLLGIHSTVDLFRRKPPLIELFYHEEYEVFLPHIRFYPVGADKNIRPEDANGNVCPFLFPISEVFSFQKRSMPDWVSKGAYGCILSMDKPTTCRLSPFGKSTGMTTGRVSYEYMAPAVGCAACETDVQVKVSDYVSSMEKPLQKEQDRRFIQAISSQWKSVTASRDPKRCNKIIKQMYNIDELLFEHKLGTDQRPPVERLVEITAAARNGNFVPYEALVGAMKNLSFEKNDSLQKNQKIH